MASLMLYILTAIVAAATYALMTYFKNRRFWKLYNKIPGKPSLPLIGNIHQIGNTSEDFLSGIYDMCKTFNYSTFKFILGTTPFVILCEPETVEVLLGNNKELSKMYDYKFLSDWLGDGLLLSTGNKWRRQRKVLTPAFHFKILEQFIDVFNERGDVFMNVLKDYKDMVFNVYNLVTLYALDVICETAMGVNIKAQENSNSEYITAVYRASELIQYRSFIPWRRNDFLYRFTSACREQKEKIDILHKMTNTVIKARKEALKDEIEKMMKGENPTMESDEQFVGKKKMAFLDLLLLSKTPDGLPLSDESIREETDTFMFEGHDTTSSAIAFAIYELSKNADIQDKVFDEQRNILGDDLSRQPLYNDLQEMKYLEMVAKETLRMYPSVPLFGRKLQDDMTLPDGTIIPGNCEVVVGTYCLGRNPKYFLNPDNFDPERFSPENTRGKNAYYYIPFSAGPRNCIGQKFAMLEIKSVISKIIRNYQLLPAGPGYELKLAGELILKSKNGVKIRISDRKYS